MDEHQLGYLFVRLICGGNNIHLYERGALFYHYMVARDE
jgi:hypothetical protein